jgi:nitroreductase
MENRVPLEFEELTEDEMLRRARAFYGRMNRRRTVREFSNRPVAREILQQAVLAAGTAPSGAHKQPWHFVLVGDAGVKARVRERAEAEEKESYEKRMPQSWLNDLAPLGTDWHKPFLTTCPWIIAVFAEAYGIDGEAGQKRKHYYVQESVGIAVGFLLAALHEAGLATLTHTPSPMGFLRQLLGRPENERAFMLIAAGFPERGCQVPDLRRKSLQEIMTEI